MSSSQNRWLRLLLISKFVCGLYQDWSSHTIIKVLAMIWCIIISFTLSVYVMYKTITIGPYHHLMILFSTDIINYLSFVFVSLFTGERYFLEYLSVVKDIDFSMQFKPCQDTVTAYVIIALHLLFVIGSFIIICIQRSELIFHLMPHVIGFIVIATVLGRITILIIFESFWKRMRLLREWVVENSNSDKSKVWETCLHTYKKMLDNVARTNKAFKLNMFLEVPVVVVKLLFITYQAVILLLHGEGDPIGVIVTINENVCSVVSYLAPAILLELVASEYEKLKTVLAKEIVLNQDKNAEPVMFVTRKYLEYRPPKYSIYRLAPIDASLAVGIASLCASYTIVLVQLSMK